MKPSKYPTLIAATLALSLSGAAQAYLLTGTIYDHVASEADFEDAISGLSRGMLASTLGSDGLPDYIGTGGYGGVQSAASFDNWWSDSHGSKSVELNLADNGSGMYSYSDSTFFPIDGELSGNEGRSHNYHFAMHLEGKTSFKEMDMFDFTGDDDLWVFINGKLVMDLGGVHGPANGHFSGSDLLGLGLLEDTVYDLDIFFAERHTTQSNFNITTSLRIEPPTPVSESSVLALFMTGLLGLGMRRCFRK
ncbi:fibro-slime domain-containing protein [Hahella sp. KA22]|uniref:fibro-slime domain-containing protein n=1 Tax=Hahella sp. KA22 TaxID=1628392 RepID=UPI000FDEECE4|nr:fibro-slime domain-containing protein [Hahella sp. KA22]AZZ94918.1 fibro-slime domain-containing protein [Hahella sp. KA22]QAY52562.1 fibro-slime domain-containing protein [Hahella sp. KA22]